jgi:hypothetical protein
MAYKRLKEMLIQSLIVLEVCVYAVRLVSSPKACSTVSTDAKGFTWKGRRAIRVRRQLRLKFVYLSHSEVNVQDGDAASPA